MSSELEQLFLQEKPTQILLEINKDRLTGDEKIAQNIAKSTDTIYAHTIKTIGKLEEQGLIERNADGVKKVIKLTDRGRRIADKLEELQQALNPAEASQLRVEQ